MTSPISLPSPRAQLATARPVQEESEKTNPGNPLTQSQILDAEKKDKKESGFLRVGKKVYTAIQTYNKL